MSVPTISTRPVSPGDDRRALVALSERAWDHIGLFLALFLSAFAVLRVYSIAGSLPVTYELLRSLGPTQIAFGVGVYLLQYFPSTLAVCLWLRAGARRKRGALGVLTIFALVVTPLLLFCVVPILVVVLWVADRRTNARPQPDRRSMAVAFAGSVALGALVLGLLGDVWLPAERLELDGRAALVGFVIETDASGFTTVLVDSDRSIMKVATESIVARTSCEPGKRSWLFQTAIWWMQSGSAPPDCDQLH
jgi:hypothetical protein